MADRISRRAARPAETAAASRDITPAGFPAPQDAGWITGHAVKRQRSPRASPGRTWRKRYRAWLTGTRPRRPLPPVRFNFLVSVVRPPGHDEDVPAFCHALGVPGLADVHVHFLPPRLLRRVWEYFDAAGPLVGITWPIRYRWPDEQRVAHLRALGVRMFSAWPTRTVPAWPPISTRGRWNSPAPPRAACPPPGLTAIVAHLGAPTTSHFWASPRHISGWHWI